MESLVRTQTAIVGNSKGLLELSHGAPVPDINGDLVLVRTEAISVNPVDAKMMGPFVTEGAISGCDFAGVVEALGPDAAQHGVRLGDRVCATIMGQDPLQPSHGAFAEHVAARAPVVVKLPDTVDFASGAALGTSFMTAGMALFKSLDLPGKPLTPFAQTEPLPVLVYGGATATGTAAIQLLRLAGFAPVVTCSPHSFALVRSYGADAVFDYHAATCGAEIRSHTHNRLRYVLDCITTTASMRICYDAIGRAGGRYTALDPFPAAVAATRKIVKADWVLGPTMLGKEIVWPAPYGPRQADPEMFLFGTRWAQTVQELLRQGLIRAHPQLVQPGGLKGALEGMEAIRAKKISGKKLVFPIRS